MTGEHVTPSSLWQGRAVPGSRWTAEQMHTLRAFNRHPDTVPTATVLRTPSYNRENWTMPPVPVPHVVPRLSLRRDGRRAKIITPAGATRWVDVMPHG